MKIEEFREKFKKGQYLLFVQKEGKAEKVEGFEKHHIYPKSFESGEILENNVVWLSVENHIKAHLLLVQDFEKHGSEDRDYSKALKAVNITCNTRWETLTESEKRAVKESIPRIAEIRQKAMQTFLFEKLEKQRKQGVKPNWGCTTKEARKKASETVEKRYGRKAGFFFTKEAWEHNKQARIRKYGTLTGNMLSPEARKKAKKTLQDRYGVESNFLRPEIRAKAKKTMIQRYGGSTRLMNRPEIKEKNRKIHEERYGSMTALMNTPEARKKAVETRRKNIKKKWAIVESIEFQNWYKKSSQVYRSPLYAVGTFLRETGRKLENL